MNLSRPTLFLLLTLLVPSVQAAEWTKKGSAFYPEQLTQSLERNLDCCDWAKQARDRMVKEAEPWMDFSDEELWGLMFGNTISRSWMVWSDGWCPACKTPVPMYNWKIDALNRPWKVQCPHCEEFFPKNDFKKFYDSGLDESGVFDPNRADRSLLFNVDHPDPADPLHRFGVDDGEGYVNQEGGKERRWRFIGAYLIYGQWKQGVLGGIVKLADAYTVTGDPEYARRAAILLDRVADLHPTFDFKAQGVLYEGPGSAGYLSTWHDSCEETREMALAYDQIFAGIDGDESLVAFLSAKAKEHRLENGKDSTAAIRKNIENRILKDALANPEKIHSNYPRKEICVAVIQTVLGWPGNREELLRFLDETITRATAVDGVTGEKGLANYSAFVIQALAQFLGLYTRMDENFLGEMMERNPKLKQTYRFHIDLWCGQKFYPLSGDTGWIGKPHPTYVGMLFQKPPTLAPSMYSFLGDLRRVTGDDAYLQVVHSANGGSTEGLPHDLFAGNPGEFQSRVQKVIEEQGTVIPLKSLNKEEWRLAVLRSGSGEKERAVWIDYDSEGGHSHLDGMNLGLFAKGLDLLTDFGYPPVQFGGWGSDRSRWYRSTLSHNTVIVDGMDQKGAAGETEFFGAGEDFRILKISGPEIYGVSRYERTVCLIDIDDENSYILDLFRVQGGREHVRRLHASFGEIVFEGIDPTPSEAWGGDKSQMKGFRSDAHPEAGWMVDWKIEDRYGLADAGREVNLRSIDLTGDGEAILAESWVVPNGYESTEEAWIPTVLTRRSSAVGPLESTFVQLIEPYEGSPSIREARRVSKEEAPQIAIEVILRDGRRDHFWFANPTTHSGEASSLLEGEGVSVPAAAAWVRYGAKGEAQTAAWVRGKGGTFGGIRIEFDDEVEFSEVALGGSVRP